MPGDEKSSGAFFNKEAKANRPNTSLSVGAIDLKHCKQRAVSWKAIVGCWTRYPGIVFALRLIQVLTKNSVIDGDPLGELR